MPQVSNNLKYGMPLLIVAFIAFFALFYGLAQFVDGGTEAAAEGDAGPAAGPVTVTLVARNIQFDKRSIIANAGAQLTVNFENQDAGVLHNLAFYTTRSATTKLAGDASVGPIFAGIATRPLSFTTGRPGNFFFRCDVHPDTMTGSLSVR